MGSVNVGVVSMEELTVWELSVWELSMWGLSVWELSMWGLSVWEFSVWGCHCSTISHLRMVLSNKRDAHEKQTSSSAIVHVT